MGDPLDGFETFLTFNDYDTYYDYFFAQWAGSDGYFYSGSTGYPDGGVILRAREPVTNDYEIAGEVPAFTTGDVAYIDGIWWVSDFSSFSTSGIVRTLLWSSDNGSTWNPISLGDDWRVPSLPVHDPVSGKWVITAYSNSYPGTGTGGPTHLAYADLTDTEWTVNGTPFTHGDEYEMSTGASEGDDNYYEPRLFFVNGIIHAYAKCEHYQPGAVFHTIAHVLFYRFADGIEEPPDTTVLLSTNDNGVYEYANAPEPTAPLEGVANRFGLFPSDFLAPMYGEWGVYVIQYDWSAVVEDGEVTSYRPPRIYYSTEFPPVWNLVEIDEPFEFPFGFSTISYDGETWLLTGFSPPEQYPPDGNIDPYYREEKRLFGGPSLGSLVPVDIEPTESMWFVGASYLGSDEWVAYAVASSDGPPEYWMVPRQGGGWGITLV